VRYMKSPGTRREELVTFVRAASRSAWQAAGRNKVALFAIAALTLLASAALLPRDVSLYEWLQQRRDEGGMTLAIARSGRKWGAFVDTPAVCLAIYAFGLTRRRARWRHAACTAFLAASLCGLSVNALRFTVGRSRPSTHQNRVVGPTLDYHYQGFPSGHTATSMATAASLLCALPAIGVPAMFSASMVAWGSWYSGAHYASDVVFGAGCGLVFGAAFGLGARREFRERNDKET
jgi:membrane-associated phospholipid phosphatase